MRPSFVFLFALLTALSAEGRIGETPAELAHRYGDGHREKVTGNVAAEFIRYSRAGYDVDVTFVDGLSVREIYRRRALAMTDEEIAQLLRGMRGHGGWRRSSKLWISGDGRLHGYRDPEKLDDFCVERVGAPHVQGMEEYRLGGTAKAK